MDFLLLLIDNIWILSAIIIVGCLIVLKSFGKAMGLVAKIIIIGIAVAFALIALGITTSTEIKEWLVGLIQGAKDFTNSDFSDTIISNYTGDQFVK